DRERSGESASDGSSNEDAVQGVNDHEQFHDRGNGGGERWDLFEPRVHRSRNRDAGDAGSARWIIARGTVAARSKGASAAAGVRVGDRGDGGGDDTWWRAWTCLVRGDRR